MIAGARIARLVLPRRSTVEIVANASPQMRVDAAVLERLTALMAAAWAGDGARPQTLCLSVSDAPGDGVEIALVEATGPPSPAPKLEEVAPIIRQLGAEIVTHDDAGLGIRARLPGRRA